ncbi:MAG: LD-carboxypeptidase [Chitinophagaceae bacterium]
MAIKIPHYLQKGDTIGIVCPAGAMPAAKAETCIRVLKQWGYKVKVGATLGSEFNYFSGSDEERLADLQAMLDDTEVKAVLCGRGGYGTNRIVDAIDWKAFRKHPKWVIGFSDITMLHSYLFTKLNTASMHAPMAAAFNDEGFKNPYVQSLKKALSGKPALYKTDGNIFNRKGVASGQLVGGNLSLLAHQVGTASDINTTDKILFIEDIGEYLYNIDRMMIQLQRSGKLKALKALIVGAFSDMKDTATPFGQTVEELIWDKVKAYDYPVCFHFPVSHEKENYALKVGLGYELSVGKNVTLKEV